MPAAAPLVLRIDALLPQTQCGRCGYPTCRDYAQAISDGVADINRCAPGGTEGIAALAGLLARAVLPLDPAHGCERPPQVALIDEDLCIGCTKCIQACPVDAIVGTGKRMHTVIADECTGCELCVPACPVDCIALLDAGAAPLPRPALLARAEQARARFEARTLRLAVAAETSLRPAHAGIARPPPTQAAPTNPAPAGPGPV
ncbi:MAG: RnfABCDGE type electron transport complex subunit B, partial [Dokdonella sp.]|nr:RnfABCDGE type electron transport complex subunit B [Dokdonella sp.]